MAIELEFMVNENELIRMIPAETPAGIPAINDTVDMYQDDTSGICNYLRVRNRQFRYNPQGFLYKVTLYCEPSQ